MPRSSRPATTTLKRYTEKRNFDVTPEPRAKRSRKAKALTFVIQKHWATRLHYDFRLELDGALMSWAVPKGPCFDPAEKRMAIHVEDHPVDYGGFEGTIPAKQYGAGTVIVWDRGTWAPVGDPYEGMRSGKLVFELHGEKLAGRWELVRIARPGDKQDAWMLFKKRDAWARPLAEYDVISALPDSVVDKPLGLVEEREPRASMNGAQAPWEGVTSPEKLPGARRAALPDALEPQLATLATAVPAQGTWSLELKFDGYRLLARIDEKGKARLFTRKGNDWTDRMDALRKAVEGMGLKSAWLDGEIVVLDAKGRPDFNALQNAFDSTHTQSISYFLFDLPFCGGHDLRAAPLLARRALLEHIIETHAAPQLRYSAAFAADLPSMLQSAQALGLEGVIAKRGDSPYVSGRTMTWLKMKGRQRQEFVIGGFIDRAASVAEVGSLLLGVYEDDGNFRYVGNVGTGWTARSGGKLYEKLVALERSKPAFTAGDIAPGRWSKRVAGNERWVAPELVAEVTFSDWTPEGRVRHAVFEGLRSDKPAREVHREEMLQVQGATRAPSIKVTHPERVIDAGTGLKKLDLVRFYESVASWLLPHLKDRAVSLVRAPTGVSGQLFFQKHDDQLSIPGLRNLDASLWPGHPPMIAIDDVDGLLNAAQMNVIEFHTMNSTVQRIGKPDRIVFDLDPGEGVAWPRVQEAAQLTRTLLEEIGLQSWLKTSGGKGLHVVVPIAPKLDHEVVKAFSQAAVQHLARTLPSRFVAKSGASNRVGKVFVDWLRNGRMATTVAAFSARARPGLGVSIPVAWDELPSLKGGAQWNIATAREHLSFQHGSDPWAAYWSTKQTLTVAMKRLGFAPDTPQG